MHTMFMENIIDQLIR